MTHELVTAKGKITVTLTETPGGTVVISHNGKPVMAIRPAREAEMPGIIRATEDVIPPETFSHITGNDLNGKTSQQRKALIYLRFRTELKFRDGVGAFDDVDGYMFDKWEKYLPSLMSDKPLSQLEQDLIMLQRSDRADLFKKNGKVNQTVAAKILGIPNGGKANYPRLQAVARELENPTISTLLEGGTDSLFGKK